jgi:subtilisin family serine protease
MLAANSLDVTKVLWNGQRVDAVRNEYVLRMPQTNAATAKSPVDYVSKTPVAQAGWSVQALGSGFFKLTAPGATQGTLTTWASRQGASYIEVNRVGQYFATPNDTLYSSADNWAFPRISAEAAWDAGTGTPSTIVAVMDSGVNYAHEDLAGNMWRNPNEIAGDGIDNDGNGFTDDVFGINAASRTGDPMDRFGHGTFCAGLIGAVGNNARGMAGVNWSVKIMAVSIGDTAPSSAAAIVAANYIAAQKVAGQNIAAVNCSFGVEYSRALEDAFRLMGSSGIVIAAAAGNDGINNDLNPQWPANFEVPEVISVAASTIADTPAGFTNFGARTVDLAAPGDNVLSTMLVGSGVGTPVTGSPGYGVDSGTSFAAPLVAGTAGLLKSLKPSASPSQIKNAILNGVDRLPTFDGVVLSGGRLNVKRSVDLLLAGSAAPPVASFVTGQNLRVLEGHVGYAMAEVKVQLDRPVDPGKSASVYYTTQPGGSAASNVDFIATSGQLTFSGSETQKSFFVKLIGDRQAEQDEQFAVQLVAAQSRGVTLGGSTFVQTNVVVLDDDNTSNPVQPGPTGPGLIPQVSIDVKRQPDPANAGQLVPVPIREGGVATFVVSLDRTSTKPVSVRYRTNQPSLVPVGTALEGVDYTATSGTITFKPGERTKEFTVSILADREADPNETFRVVLTEPLNADLAGAGGSGNAGGAVTATITDVAFVPPPLPGFQITLSFPDNSLTTSQQVVFQQAASRWEQIIVGDLPNVTDPVTGRLIDDVLIEATGPAIDGSGGILGAAGPTDLRPGAGGLPWKGVMFFDSADIARMEADGTFRDVILHEMGHVLGFGTLWSRFGLVRGAGGTNPTYVGTNALREYRSIFGLPNATGVPVENSGGQGTADSHWRETVFVTELMTGYAEPAGTAMPISRITVGALQDIGYQVNYARADAYTRPAPLTAPPAVRVTPPALVRGRPVSVARPAANRIAAPAMASAFAQMATDQLASRPSRAAGKPAAVVAVR